MYKEYHKLWYLMILSKRDLEELQSQRDDILSQLASLTSQQSETGISSHNLSDKICNLVARKIDLEKIIEQQQVLYDFRKERVNLKLQELKNSADLKDRIYYFKFVSKFKTSEVAKSINYTREYTYELIAKIRNDLKIVENDVRPFKKTHKRDKNIQKSRKK